MKNIYLINFDKVIKAKVVKKEGPELWLATADGKFYSVLNAVLNEKRNLVSHHFEECSVLYRVKFDSMYISHADGWTDWAGYAKEFSSHAEALAAAAAIDKPFYTLKIEIGINF